ncbi:MAG: bifunctional DNA-binding transcriptional regulator/O6-methylguanine-DNA methyltransferase Ada [Gemmatirosa sp.]|nr:bifunctional DNA-binding transcriptional regulator/O6-methylguanine-DNA methyltransferase Ada [Gemmatirosa sp.]
MTTMMTMQPEATITDDVHDDQAWRAVETRDAAWDGRVVYAVTSTGIYCRPSCPSRRPSRHRVRFFDAPQAAARAGFRACQRCRPDDQSRAEASVAAARASLDAHLASPDGERPTLARLAAVAGMSPYHLQRVFKAQVGLTPAEYLRAGLSERLKAELRRGETVSRATYGAGFGSGSRAYEAADVHLGMTPATYRAGGRGAVIHYRVVPSSYGQVLVAATERGLCAVTLGDDADALVRQLAGEYPRATLAQADGDSAGAGQFAAWVDAVVGQLDAPRTVPSVPLDPRGTAFQRRVWRALQAIPAGETRSYADVAAAIGAPAAVRAVAQACATNPVAVIVPCHRVIRRDGGLSGYRWGVERKRRLLAAEAEGARGG